GEVAAGVIGGRVEVRDRHGAAEPARFTLQDVAAVLAIKMPLRGFPPAGRAGWRQRLSLQHQLFPLIPEAEHRIAAPMRPGTDSARLRNQFSLSSGMDSRLAGLCPRPRIHNVIITPPPPRASACPSCGRWGRGFSCAVGSISALTRPARRRRYRGALFPASCAAAGGAAAPPPSSGCSTL